MAHPDPRIGKRPRFTRGNPPLTFCRGASALRMARHAPAAMTGHGRAFACSGPFLGPLVPRLAKTTPARPIQGRKSSHSASFHYRAIYNQRVTLIDGFWLTIRHSDSFFIIEGCSSTQPSTTDRYGSGSALPSFHPVDRHTIPQSLSACATPGCRNPLLSNHGRIQCPPPKPY